MANFPQQGVVMTPNSPIDSQSFNSDNSTVNGSLTIIELLPTHGREWVCELSLTVGSGVLIFGDPMVALGFIAENSVVFVSPIGSITPAILPNIIDNIPILGIVYMSGYLFVVGLNPYGIVEAANVIEIDGVIYELTDQVETVKGAICSNPFVEGETYRIRIR